MTMADLKAKEYQRFEDIKHTTEGGVEFWYARKLSPVLEYTEWRNFNKVIDRRCWPVRTVDLPKVGTPCLPMPPTMLVLRSRWNTPSSKMPGYMGLYGGLRVSDIHACKGLAPEQKILDHMGSEELGANLFRITQTEAKMRRDDPQGLREDSVIHYTVGKEVRDAIKKIGGEMPEDLPTPEKSISEIERQQLKKLKED